LHYTKRDHDTLVALAEEADERGEVVMANKKLATKLGITPGAAVPRLDRLRALELIKIEYDINPYNGNVRRRSIFVPSELPSEPFTKPKAETAEAPLTEAELEELDRLVTEMELEPDPDAPLVENVDPDPEWGLGKIDW
jgi:DNA-binding Lrp family transcriptional regulator